MVRMELALAGLLVIAMMVPAFVQDPKILTRKRIFHRSVQAGGEVQAFTYARLNKSCTADAPPGSRFGSIGRLPK